MSKYNISSTFELQISTKKKFDDKCLDFCVTVRTTYKKPYITFQALAIKIEHVINF